MISVSCVIPKRNGGDYFFESLRLLEAQSHPFSQIVVSEDNSDDGSFDKVVALNGKNNIVVGVPPQRLPGMGANIAFGLGLLDPGSDYTLIGSVDDLWNKDFLKRLIDDVLSENQERPVCIFSDRWIIDERGVLTGCTGSKTHPLISKTDDWDYYLKSCRFIIHGALFRTDFLLASRELLHATGQSADWVIIAEAARRGRIVYYPFPLWRFRIHSASTSATRKTGHAQNLKGYSDYLLAQGDEVHAGDVKRLATKLEEAVDDPAANWQRKAGRRDPHSRGRLRVVLAALFHGSGLSLMLRPWLRRVYRSSHVN